MNELVNALQLFYGLDPMRVATAQERAGIDRYLNGIVDRGAWELMMQLLLQTQVPAFHVFAASSLNLIVRSHWAVVEPSSALLREHLLQCMGQGYTDAVLAQLARVLAVLARYGESAFPQAFETCLKHPRAFELVIALLQEIRNEQPRDALGTGRVLQDATEHIQAVFQMLQSCPQDVQLQVMQELASCGIALDGLLDVALDVARAGPAVCATLPAVQFFEALLRKAMLQRFPNKTQQLLVALAQTLPAAAALCFERQEEHVMRNVMSLLSVCASFHSVLLVRLFPQEQPLLQLMVQICRVSQGHDMLMLSNESWYDLYSALDMQLSAQPQPQLQEAYQTLYQSITVCVLEKTCFPPAGVWCGTWDAGQRREFFDFRNAMMDVLFYCGEVMGIEQFVSLVLGEAQSLAQKSPDLTTDIDCWRHVESLLFGVSAVAQDMSGSQGSNVLPVVLQILSASSRTTPQLPDHMYTSFLNLVASFGMLYESQDVANDVLNAAVSFCLPFLSFPKVSRTAAATLQLVCGRACAAFRRDPSVVFEIVSRFSAMCEANDPGCCMLVGGCAAAVRACPDAIQEQLVQSVLQSIVQRSERVTAVPLTPEHVAQLSALPEEQSQSIRKVIVRDVRIFADALQNLAGSAKVSGPTAVFASGHLLDGDPVSPAVSGLAVLALQRIWERIAVAPLQVKMWWDGPDEDQASFVKLYCRFFLAAIQACGPYQIAPLAPSLFSLLHSLFTGEDEEPLATLTKIIALHKVSSGEPPLPESTIDVLHHALFLMAQRFFTELGLTTTERKANNNNGGSSSSSSSSSSKTNNLIDRQLFGRLMELHARQNNRIIFRPQMLRKFFVLLRTALEMVPQVFCKPGSTLYEMLFEASLVSFEQGALDHFEVLSSMNRFLRAYVVEDRPELQGRAINLLNTHMLRLFHSMVHRLADGAISRVCAVPVATLFYSVRRRHMALHTALMRYLTETPGFPAATVSDADKRSFAQKTSLVRSENAYQTLYKTLIATCRQLGRALPASQTIVLD